MSASSCAIIAFPRANILERPLHRATSGDLYGSCIKSRVSSGDACAYPSSVLFRLGEHRRPYGPVIVFACKVDMLISCLVDIFLAFRTFAHKPRFRFVQVYPSQTEGNEFQPTTVQVCWWAHSIFQSDGHGYGDVIRTNPRNTSTVLRVAQYAATIN